ncbi:MAG: hypothetical protein KAH20_03900 [Methylococcales bacterium]|nr:hypothetical protein [Methylococcales bacterium]
MNTSRKISVVAVLAFIATSANLLDNEQLISEKESVKVVGKLDPGNLLQSYNRWKKDYEKGQTVIKGPSIGLTWNKGLSSEYSKAQGLANINIETGVVTVEIKGNIDKAISEVWLVENIDKQGNTIQPDANDKIIRLGSLVSKDNSASLSAQLNPMELKNLDVDWVVVTRKDNSPIDGGVLYGSTSLFQKIYHYPQRFLSANSKNKTRLPSLVSPALADGIFPEKWFPSASLVNEGRNIFFKTTFEGNGRTCGTCHPEKNNYTLDPKFIAKLPKNDPLFVAERPEPNPLAKGFENPKLMRRAGLIMENTNGFGNLETNYTMRAVSHVLGVKTSVSPPSLAGNDGTVGGKFAPEHRTGWSGDGSPVGIVGNLHVRGTIRDFTVGAIRQHMPKTLARTPGVDFRLPTEHELNALEAYMLSLGRQKEFDDFTQITMSDERADRGRLNYMGENVDGDVNCNACHFNGGANTNPDFNFPILMTPPSHEFSNRSFSPRVEELIDQLPDLIDFANNPKDDGFGSGTNLFNVQTVIEAADTGPFFHAHQIDTVEAMVAFYSSKRTLKNGEVLPPIIGLNGAQVANIGAFLRVLNADENSRSAIQLIDQASDFSRRKEIRTNLSIARSEITDAIQVLEGANLHFDDALPLLRLARHQIRHAKSAYRAVSKLKKARRMMIKR